MTHHVPQRFLWHILEHSIWQRRRFFMKIVVVKPPKALRGFLAAIFGVR